MVTLSRNDWLILKALKQYKKTIPEVVARATGLKVEGILQSAYVLKEAGFADIQEKVDFVYELTDEGRNYAEQGLPERQVYDYLTINGPTKLSDLKRIFPAVNIAIGWLKRRNWASITKIDNDSVLTPEPAPEAIEEKLLSDVKFEKSFRIDDIFTLPPADATQAVALLIKRHLATVREVKSRNIVITDLGEKAELKEEVEVERDIADLTPELIQTGAWKGRLKRYNVKAETSPIYPGKTHPLRRLIDEVREIFISMGFTEFKGPIVESEFHNFDVLFMPQDHPARDEQDTFYLARPAALELPTDLAKRVGKTHILGCAGSIGWGGEFDFERSKRAVLRTHTTGSAFRYLTRHPEPPAMIFGVDRVFRRESMDSTHLPQFHQCEGTIHGEDLSLAELLGVLKTIFEELGFHKVRFRPGYFPFTEPSLEGDILVNGRWMELVGAGVFRPEVTQPLGLKSVLGFSIGIERIAMFRLGIDDIRELYLNNIDWLRGVATTTF
jgi:phenylalanyl-tRNA synthetase alpha chain